MTTLARLLTPTPLVVLWLLFLILAAHVVIASTPLQQGANEWDSYHFTTP